MNCSGLAALARGSRSAIQVSWVWIAATFQPAVSVPADFTADGLPVGIQIIGRYRDDFGVLKIAHAFEQATGFGRRRPQIAQG